MSAFASFKFACSLATALGGKYVVNVVATHSSPARARKRGRDHLSEFFAAPSRGRRPALFQPDWLDLETGERRRASRFELREAYRLWAVHRDIRLARLKP
jgi:hypothetical protein